MIFARCTKVVKSHLVKHENYRITYHIEHIHDGGVVRAFEVQNSALWKVIIISWMIAFVEYCFQVPANRVGSAMIIGAVFIIFKKW